MRVDGHWLRCDDGVIRPTVQGQIRLADGEWLEIPFLLDAGADRTVFSSDLFDLLQPLEIGELRLAGVGGASGAILISTEIGFTRDDGKLVTIRGTFGVFTDYESADLSILGRDVTNNFGVIYDYPNRLVALLAQPHSYEIKLLA
ncbi:MAG: hypothetical protein AAB401_21605 [Acidobacteriota bacterium]